MLTRKKLAVWMVLDTAVNLAFWAACIYGVVLLVKHALET